MTDNGIDAKETLFIDDSEENVMAARQLGIDSVLCKDHAVLLRELQDLGVV